MSTADDVFMRQFGLILAFLVVFAFAVFFIASDVGNDSLDKIQGSPSAVQERIAPAGAVEVDASAAAVSDAATPAATPAPSATVVAVAAAAPAAAASAAPAVDGKAAYQTACVACHMTGVANAPKLTDAANWTERAKAGMDGLLKSVLGGKGAMPPKGGSTLDEASIRATIQYMLKEAGVEAS